MASPFSLRRSTRWAWVAHALDNPAGPSFRGRCSRCPWDGPIRRVPSHRVDDDVIAAAAKGYGPIAEAALGASRDITMHMRQVHGRIHPLPTRDRLTFHVTKG